MKSVPWIYVHKFWTKKFSIPENVSGSREQMHIPIPISILSIDPVIVIKTR